MVAQAGENYVMAMVELARLRMIEERERRQLLRHCSEPAPIPAEVHASRARALRDADAAQRRADDALYNYGEALVRSGTLA